MKLFVVKIAADPELENMLNSMEELGYEPIHVWRNQTPKVGQETTTLVFKVKDAFAEICRLGFGSPDLPDSQDDRTNLRYLRVSKSCDVLSPIHAKQL